MKNRIPALFSAICALVLTFGVTAKALTFGDGNDLGLIRFGIPSGDADRVSYVNHLIGMALNTNDSFSGQDFFRSGNSCGTCASVSLPIVNGTGTSVDLGSGGYIYLFAKYDGPNAGSEVWFIGGMSGLIDIPAKGTPDKDNKYGLSGWSLFKGNATTPDSGTTAALLGFALTGLAGLRARLGRK
jgi:hypothetical protein